MEDRLCPYCLREISDKEVEYCPLCGEYLGEYDDWFDESNRVKKKKKSKAGKALSILLKTIGIAALALAIFLAVLFFTGNSSQKADATGEGTASALLPDVSSDENDNAALLTASPSPTAAAEPEPTEEPTPAPTLIPVVPEGSTFEVHYLNVGQGDSSLVICDGNTMLIDGGDESASQLLFTYLKEHGVTELDYVVATHPHSDHIGGLPGALVQAPARRALCSYGEYDSVRFTKFEEKLNGIPIEIPLPGDTYQLGNAKVTVLGPIRSNTSLNNESLVLRIDYGNTSFLFAGDAEREEEWDILNSEYAGLLDCDVLKVGHHGSSSSSSVPFLKSVSPKLSVISVGRENSYGHPSKGTTISLKIVGSNVVRTDSLKQRSHVIVSSDGYNVYYGISSVNEETVMHPVVDKKALTADREKLQ